MEYTHTYLKDICSDKEQETTAAICKKIRNGDSNIFNLISPKDSQLNPVMNFVVSGMLSKKSANEAIITYATTIEEFVLAFVALAKVDFDFSILEEMLDSIVKELLVTNVGEPCNKFAILLNYNTETGINVDELLSEDDGEIIIAAIKDISKRVNGKGLMSIVVEILECDAIKTLEDLYFAVSIINIMGDIRLKQQTENHVETNSSD